MTDTLSNGEKLVNAPGGPRPQSLVHRIPDGHRLHVENGVAHAVDGLGNKHHFPTPSDEALAWAAARSASSKRTAGPAAKVGATSALPPMQAPGTITSGPGAVWLTWAAVPGATSYSVYRNGVVREATVKATNFNDTTAPTSGMVTYAIAYTTAAGTSDPGAVLTLNLGGGTVTPPPVTTPPPSGGGGTTPPSSGIITDLKAVANGTTEIDLTWTPVPGCATAIYRSSPFSTRWLANMVGPGGTSYRDNFGLLRTGTKYTYEAVPVPMGTLSAPASASTDLALAAGWQAFAQTTMAGSITRFEAKWGIPTTPSRFSDQTLFYFPCTADTIGGSSLLQPVLQYGGSSAGGWNYWSIASWYMLDHNLFSTRAIEIDDPAEILHGKISITGNTATVWFEGHNDATTISISGDIYLTQPWAAMTVESYFTEFAWDLLAGDCTMTVETLRLSGDNSDRPVTWTETDWLSGATAKLSNNGTTAATVTIHTPHSGGASTPAGAKVSALA